MADIPGMRTSRWVSSLLALVAAMVSFALVAAAPAAASQSPNLRSITAGSWTDGDNFGAWRVVFAGYGSVTSSRNSISLSPKAAAEPGATHAGLVVSQQAFTSTKLVVNATLTTSAQLRTGSAPNPWEVGWLVWDYQDNEHFTYAIAKPNGWELGKRDPAYPGGQRFLATGSDITVPVGTPAKFTVVRTVAANGSTVTILKLQGVKVATFTDTERPYTSGSVGIYSEDATITATGVSAR